MNRKASLDLSVNSIVVMVIAFVVLGLILTFTRGIFSFGQKQLGGIEGLVDLTQKPSVEEQFVPTSFVLKAGEYTRYKVGLYNNKPNTLKGATLSIPDNCAGSDSIGKPGIKTSSMDDIASGSFGTGMILMNPGTMRGENICVIKITGTLGTDSGGYEKKVQVSISVRE